MLKQLLRLVTTDHDVVKIATIAGVFLLSSLAIFGQDAGEPADTILYSTRLVCIEATGCLYTRLDDAALDAMFPDQQRFIGVDVMPEEGSWDLAGAWETVCGPEAEDESIPPRSYTQQIEVLESGEEHLTIVGFSFNNEAVFSRIGPGTYVGELVWASGVTGLNWTMFFVVVDESTIHAISTGNRSEMEVTCAYTSLAYMVRREAE